MKNINPTQTSAWQALQKHFDEMKDVTIAICSRKIATVF
jgi:glucose-6-phosphate isomerase